MEQEQGGMLAQPVRMPFHRMLALGYQERQKGRLQGMICSKDRALYRGTKLIVLDAYPAQHLHFICVRSAGNWLLGSQQAVGI